MAPELCTRAALNETINYALGLCDVAGPYPKVLAKQKIAEFSTNGRMAQNWLRAGLAEK
jgi:hypothetical protein